MKSSPSNINLEVKFKISINYDILLANNKYYSFIYIKVKTTER